MSMPDSDGFVVDTSVAPPPSGPPPDVRAETPDAPTAHVEASSEPELQAAPEDASGEADAPAADEQPRDERGKFAKKDSLQARIDRATWEKHEAIRERERLAARVAELERATGVTQQPTAPPVPDGKPKLEDYATYEEHAEAVIEWKLDQRDKARQAAAVQQAYNERVAAFTEKTPDFQERMLAWANNGGNAHVTDAMRDAVLTSPRGPEIAYWLATHQPEGAQLAQQTARLGTDAAPLVRQLLEAKLSPTASSGPVAGVHRPSVPPPIKPVGSAPVVADPPLDSLDVDAFVARENARERNERKARLGLK